MTVATKAILSSWSIDPDLTIALSACALIYVRGWIILHRITPTLFSKWRLLSFLSGLTVFWLAVNSPLDAVSSLLLSAHMVQHILLLMVVAPLLLLGAPVLPLLRGLPRPWVRDGIAPFFHWGPFRKIAHFLMAPAAGWVLMSAALCGWHIPAAFELTLRSPAWHKVEHGCFVGAALLFWWPVVRPFPYRAHWPLWRLPIYLFAADLANTALSGVLTFSDHVLYPTYAQAPRLFGSTALADQATAGVIMWVPGSLAFMVPAVVIAVRLLSTSALLARPGATRGRPSASEAATPIKSLSTGNNKRSPFDLLAVPILGSLLRSRPARRTMQIAMLLLAIVIVVDGIRGPQSSALNLAGVLPWTYWRALTVIALLAAGNFFCMACPFTLARDLGMRVVGRKRPWPRALRSKWFALVLLALFFWAYEVFGLWDKPIWTAWLIIDYFVVAFSIDALFRGASFCKYVCPIGQFQFITSLVSPLEVKARSPDVCASCKTHDCLRGNQTRRGCGTDLFLPRKAGNFDCTFCLDCVRACPHDNVGLIATAPGLGILNDFQGSSVGRLSRRVDLAALALVFVFAAFVNAAAMTAPFAAWSDRLAARIGALSPRATSSILLLVSLILVPAMIAFFVTRLSRLLGGVSIGARELFCRFSMCLVPLGAAMWAVHFLYHLDTGWTSGSAAFRRVAEDLGWRLFDGSKSMSSAPFMSADAMLVTQTLGLDAGLLLALYLGWRLAKTYTPRARDALYLLAPWAGVAAALFGFGIWIFLQPMQMRGMVSSMP